MGQAMWDLQRAENDVRRSQRAKTLPGKGQRYVLYNRAVWEQHGHRST
jgi:hypothetical protein